LSVGGGLRAAQAGKLVPAVSAVSRAEDGGVVNARVDRIRIGQRGFEMPDPLELKGTRCAVVPLMGARFALVDELVIERFPGLATVVGALDHLPVPAGGLRPVDAIRIRGRAIDVVNITA